MLGQLSDSHQTARLLRYGNNNILERFATQVRYI